MLVSDMHKYSRFAVPVALASAILLQGGICAAAADDSQLPDYPQTSTMAGSGAPGIIDGPANTARFLAPIGISFDRSGNLIVADRDAQRIRKITPSGSVSTVAGNGALVALGIGVAGGFRDGTAQSARFNGPQSLVALDSGAIIVADTGNACLRKISNGVVQTFAGLCTHAGSLNGSAQQARFAAPRSIVAASDGSMYIADPPNGVRKVATNGNVTTLDFDDSKNVVALAAIPGDAHRLIASTSQFMDVLELPSLKRVAHYPLETNFLTGPPTRESIAAAGPMYGIAAYNGHDFAFTDPLTSTVRFVQILRDVAFETRPLTSVPAENRATTGIPFADGPAAQATFNSPFGIALAPDGRIAVADTGNRRIRLLSRFNRHTHISVDTEGGELPSADPSTYTIAVVGSSFIWFNQSWHASMAGMLEDRLRASGHKGFAKVRVVPIMRQGVSPLAALNLIDTLLAEGVVNAVVFDFPGQGHCMAEPDRGANFPPNWTTAIASALRKTKADLDASNTKFLVAWHPGALDLPLENSYRKEYKGTRESGAYSVPRTPITQIESDYESLHTVLKTSGVELINQWPAFLHAYNDPRHAAIFGAWDHHMTEHGRTIFVDSLAENLEREIK